MTGTAAAEPSRKQRRTPQPKRTLFDRELGDLPPELRWREWMMRVEAVIFASAEPVTRETLARVVGKDCSIDLLIDDLHEELRSRPYELVSVAGGWQHRTVRLTRTQSGHHKHLRAVGRPPCPSLRRWCLWRLRIPSQ
jgi:segregation and condensation protein B